MIRVCIVFTGLVLLGSCTQRMICPAYQSAFIYDKDKLRKQFSYFLEDSTPKIYTASKNKYLVAEPVTYRKKIRDMQTVRMKAVPVIVPDSLSSPDSVSMADLDRAARSVIDSTVIVDVPQNTPSSEGDSVYVISKDRELRLLKYDAPDSLFYDEVVQKYVPEKPKYYVKDVRYTTEQDNYMWYLRHNLVLPDVRLAKMAQSGQRQESAKKSKKGFFKNLFRKKEKTEVDSAALKAPSVPEEEFDFIDQDTVAQALPANEPVSEKRGIFSPGRKKSAKTSDGKSKEGRKNKKTKAPALTEEEKKKKEEEDDGF